MKPTHILTIRSKSGRPLNITKSEPVESCSVYGLVDLGQRLAAFSGREDPDLEVDVQEITEDMR
jgi:hypothetical protein